MWYLYVDGKLRHEDTWGKLMSLYETLSREHPKALITLSERKRNS